MIVNLTAELIEAFAGMFLSTRYDNPKPVAQFHRDGWNLYCSKEKQAEIVAPRGHAKSTSFTFSYISAEVCFRKAQYVILIGSTEDKAAEQLSNISDEFHINEDLRREFGIVGFESDQKTEIIVNCDDGYQFRIIARGAEQKIRGAMWKGKRPDLIVCDDMEDDEQVENIERRKKFRRWFFRAVVPALSKTGRIRVHGTILHEDSLLARLMKNKTWKCLFYKAHESYADFSNLLWPEQWNASELRKIQQSFEAEGDSAGYSQEYLNTPLDNADAFIRKADLLPMEDEDYDLKKIFYIGADFAVSKQDRANRTSFTVGGRSIDGYLHIVDQYVDRWSTDEWVDKIFEIDSRWRPEEWYVEDGVIWKSVYPMIADEMRMRDHFINFVPLLPVKDKGVRGQSFKKRSRSGSMKWDKKADWYTEYENEILQFTGVAQAKLDDQFDSTAIMCKGLDDKLAVEEEDLDERPPEDEDEETYEQFLMEQQDSRNVYTGY
jgi:phage terminase large subunit-like protein